ncbi:MAG TPA: hypothetical protein VHL32_01685 [Gemmatimonadaceae bacterium]|nr:hypothetical protein [Gemmatimonadaceae bacterium]
MRSRIAGDRPPRLQPERDAICRHRGQPGHETNERAEDRRNKVGKTGAQETLELPRVAGEIERNKSG